MKLISALLLLLASLPTFAFEHFITRSGAALFDGEKQFRFVGIHAPELHRIEDDARGHCALDKRPWGQYFKWPTAWEQENWIQSMVFTGHKAMRVYVLSVESDQDLSCGRQTHILKPLTPLDPPRLYEAAMVHYDRMIALADQYGLRLILPFIDHWQWWGGRAQLAAFYGEQEDDFYRVQSKTFRAYLQIIEQVILRKNTLTGRLYRDEKAIMAWETGNELKGTGADFLQLTAAKIKTLDPNHLLIDGTYTRINDFALNDPNVDIISNHFYLNANNLHPQQIAQDLQEIAAKKAYLVGEFGLAPAKQLTAIVQAVVHTQVNGVSAVGGFLWGMRGHRQEGGFYWHDEGGKAYSYHLPGFAEGDGNSERELVDATRTAAAQLDGLKRMRPLPKPLPPYLLPIQNPRERIMWSGSAVGRHYTVQRALSPLGPWQVIGASISDGMNRYDPINGAPLFQDVSPKPAGAWLFYRVIAHNESGQSAPSNIQVVRAPL